MAAKRSQLQIRVTDAEKKTLKRLAGAAKMSVSQYVLAQALPSRHMELSRLLEQLARRGGGHEGTLNRLAAFLSETPAADFGEVLAHPPLDLLSPLHQNELAAAVERAAHAKSAETPNWVAGVPRLGRPHFAWSLMSLRPHQVRVAPVPFKRRGIFFDPATRASLPSWQVDAGDPHRTPEALRRLRILSNALATKELKVEFYLLGGALISQAFHARPPTAHVSALFRPTTELAPVIDSLTHREGWEPTWLEKAVREYLAGGGPDRYLELPGLAVFVPALEYVLALKVASLRPGTTARALDDLRYVLRALNLANAAAALEVAGRYFGPRQLPGDARATLESLLAP
jgi:hypothetical protein